jgi:hypothetical protein
MPDSGVPAATFPTAARAAVRTLSPLISPTHFHEEPLFYNALRFGMAYVDPGASYYEERYRERVPHNLHRRARHFGFTLVADATARAALDGVS